jgi:hypothetical protein
VQSWRRRRERGRRTAPSGGGPSEVRRASDPGSRPCPAPSSRDGPRSPSRS